MIKLKITLADHHPQVQELQSQIDTTRRGLTAALQGDLSNAVAAAHPPRTVQESAKTELTQQNPATVANRPAIDPIHAAPRSQYANVSVVSRATPPVKAVKPKLLTGLALGVMAALALGFGIPIGYELFNRRVRCRDDLERHHGVPVLVEFGALPMIRTAL